MKKIIILLLIISASSCVKKPQLQCMDSFYTTEQTIKYYQSKVIMEDRLSSDVSTPGQVRRIEELSSMYDEYIYLYPSRTAAVNKDARLKLISRIRIVLPAYEESIYLP